MIDRHRSRKSSILMILLGITPLFIYFLIFFFLYSPCIIKSAKMPFLRLTHTKEKLKKKWQRMLKRSLNANYNSRSSSSRSSSGTANYDKHSLGLGKIAVIVIPYNLHNERDKQQNQKWIANSGEWNRKTNSNWKQKRWPEERNGTEQPLLFSSKNCHWN